MSAAESLLTISSTPTVSDDVVQNVGATTYGRRGGDPELAPVEGALVVGQFSGGKIKVFHSMGDGKFAKGEWLKAGGEVAKVPGVW